MKHLKIYIVFLILICSSVVGFWIYTRYIKSDKPIPLMFTVERGSLDQLVRARGKIVTQKAYDLAFATSGTIQAILVKEGESVQEHQPLIQLDTLALQRERTRLVSVSSQRQSSYNKLLAGARVEEVKVYATKVQSADASVSDAEHALINVQSKADADLEALYGQVSDLIKSASVTADDSVRQQTEVLFSNDDTANPKLTVSFSNSSLISQLESDRVVMGQELKALSEDTVSSVGASDAVLDGLLKSAEIHLGHVQAFLDVFATALNSTINLSDTTIATYKTSINTGRAAVNTSRTSITALQQKIAVQKSANQQLLTQAQSAVNSAKNSLTLSQDQLSLQTAGALSQDLNSANAAIKEVQDQIASIDDQIEKSVLKAPAAGVVSHIAYESHEVVQAGAVVVNFSANGQKVESDVSELNIALIHDDGAQTAVVKLDAYPGTLFKGHVMSVDVQEVIKDSDTYYRVNLLLDEEGDLNIRSGMNADVIYKVSTVENVLTVPAFLVRKENGQQVVTVMRSGKQRNVIVKTGVTDGDRIEVLEGLSEGETVLSSAL